jgi:hypothetical protein
MFLQHDGAAFGERKDSCTAEVSLPQSGNSKKRAWVMGLAVEKRIKARGGTRPKR